MRSSEKCSLAELLNSISYILFQFYGHIDVFSSQELRVRNRLLECRHYFHPEDFLLLLLVLITHNTILYNTAYTRKKRADNNYTAIFTTPKLQKQKKRQGFYGEILL